MKNESVTISGYSERGMVNALCYEMRHSADGLRLLREFINLFSFPYSKPDFEDVQSARFIIEQSFSDFGDLDLLILLDGKIKQAVLLEAKVKTSQTNDWSIASQWAAFCEVPKAVAKTSNLFMQLYRKMRLIRKIQCSGEELPHCGRSPKTSFGQNTVVNDAIKMLRNYCLETWFVSLVPSSKSETQHFFGTEISKPITDLPHWDYNKVGYLTWEDLEKHCRNRSNDWPLTLENFDYNRGQIFGRTEVIVERRPPPPGSSVIWNSGTTEHTVVIKNRGRLRTRVFLANGDSKKVPNGELLPLSSALNE